MYHVPEVYAFICLLLSHPSPDLVCLWLFLVLIASDLQILAAAAIKYMRTNVH